MAVVTREQMIEQSVQNALRRRLFTGPTPVYSDPSKVEIRDSFDPGDYDGALDKNYVALGFNFDDGGKPGEMGSSLVMKTHTIELFVLGATAVWGSNLSAAVAQTFPPAGVVALEDPTNGNAIIDYLVIDECQRERQVVPDPDPWQEHIWLVRLRVEDEYFAQYG